MNHKGTNSQLDAVEEQTDVNRRDEGKANEGADYLEAAARHAAVLPIFQVGWRRLSRWSQSSAKRIFDCSCILFVFPLVALILLATALAVRLSSRGPILFVQDRVGCQGKLFRILKFRTLVHAPVTSHSAVTTSANQEFTPVGRFLRRWKLDEMPQILNVLAGHMSLVGPRPKIPEHVKFNPPCRPGLTCAGTISFAREERVLAHIPSMYLNTYYHAVVLPAKRHLDSEYMAHATLRTDLRLLVRTALRRWDDDSILKSLPNYKVLFPQFESQQVAQVTLSIPPINLTTLPIPPAFLRYSESAESSAD